MRDYAKISPAFWIQGSGRRLRGEPVAMLVALYLMSCPSASMVGLYYINLPTICHETSLTPQQVRDALATCERAGIAYYDEDHEIAWVPNLARYQIGDVLHPKDAAKRTGVVNAVKRFEHHRFYRMFLDLYNKPYALGLPMPKGEPAGPTPGATRGPAGSLPTPDRVPCARAHAPVPDPVPDQREPDREDPAEPEPPASGPLPDGVVAVERTFWVESYKTGIAAGGGPAAYVFPEVKFKALRGVVEGLCTGEDRRNIPSWIQRLVTLFAKRKRALGWPPNTVDPWHPDALLAWTNSDDYAEQTRARSAPRLKTARPAPTEPPAPRMSPQEMAANAAKLAGMIRGFGTGG